MCCHSIQLDPDDPKRMYVAISAAGTFRSEDGGESWEPANSGVAADFFPDNPFPEVGPVRAQAARPPGPAGAPLAAEPLRRLPLRRPRPKLGAPRGQRAPERLRLPDHARPVAIRTPPSSSRRRAPRTASRLTGGWASTAHTTAVRAGSSSRAASRIRPGWPCSASLRRSTRSGVYFGTQSGSVFASADGGDSWVEAATHLPPILSVEAADWR